MERTLCSHYLALGRKRPYDTPDDCGGRNHLAIIHATNRYWGKMAQQTSEANQSNTGGDKVNNGAA